MSRLWILVCCLCWAASPALAGTACTAQPVDADRMASIARAALRTQAALDAADAPVALVGRVGADLSRHGLHYSHVGFVVRDHPDGRWTVVHVLNHCGSSRSGLYAEGLLDFFADDLINYDVRILGLRPAVAQRLAGMLSNAGVANWHEPRYSVIARPDSPELQNSTAFVLEVLVAAMDSSVTSRPVSQRRAAVLGHRPDIIRIPYSQRVLGGLFSANTVFTDHPVGARLSGRYPVVTPRSIQRFLHDTRLLTWEREWRADVELAQPLPM